jgi:hypothetical protein
MWLEPEGLACAAAGEPMSRGATHILRGRAARLREALMRRAAAIALFGLFAGAGFGTLRLVASAVRERPPDAAVILTQVREAVRLETLDVTLYKKITFAPKPVVTGSFWKDVLTWARYTLRAPRGKALIFAEAHLGLDLARLDAGSFFTQGRDVYVVLPPVQASVELKPADTEVIDSNLDSEQTAQLFELARAAFMKEVLADAALTSRARASAERAVRAMLRELGFAGVYFVARLPQASPS